MRFVLDESAPRRLAVELSLRGVDVSAFPRDWKGLKNGRLLAQLLEAGFDGLITCDKNLRFQQNLAPLGLAIVVLPSPFFHVLKPLMDEIATLVASAGASETIEIAVASATATRRT